MRVKPRRRNEALAYWIEQSGASLHQLAADLRELATGQRINCAPDRARVYRWKAYGERPRDPMPDLLAAVLTLRCRRSRPLTRDDIGLGAPAQSSDRRLPWSTKALVDTIQAATQGDLMSYPDDSPAGPMLHGAALLRAVRPWLDHRPGPLPAPTGATRRIGATDVAALRAATTTYRSADNTSGGGLTREAAVAQLMSANALLGHARTSEAVGRDLLSAVADLAGVAGWMTHDAGRSAEGQRYLLLGVSAAAEAGDVELAAHLINCLARVSAHVGRIDDALEMVHLAQYGTRHLPAGRLRAILGALEARYLAITGDLTGFDRAAGTAADLLDQASDEREWVQWFDIAEFHATIGIAHTLAARWRPHPHLGRAVHVIERAIQLRPAARVRSLAFDHIGLARAHTLAGTLDGAEQAATTALSLTTSLASTRVAERLAELDHDVAALPATPTSTRIRDQLRTALANDLK